MSADEMDTGDAFREMRRERQARRAERRDRGTDDIIDLRALGYDVVKLTDCQFRINRRLDLYPTNRRYHDIRTGKRGFYRNLEAFVARAVGQVSAGKQS